MQRESVKRSFSPALTLTSGMILSESLNLSEPQFSPLLNGANNTSLAPSALGGLRLNECVGLQCHSAPLERSHSKLSSLSLHCAVITCHSVKRGSPHMLALTIFVLPLVHEHIYVLNKSYGIKQRTNELSEQCSCVEHSPRC